MENEIKTNEEVKEETPTEEVAPAEESKTEEAASKEEKVEEVEPITYSSKYLENIEEERAKFLKVYKTQNAFKWVVSLVCIAAVIFGCIVVPNLIGGTNGTIAMVVILVVALAATILYSVLTRKSIRKKMEAYFNLYYENMNKFVFEGEATEINSQFPGKIQNEAFLDNGLYKDVIEVGSRGLTEIKYHDIDIAVVDAAAQVRQDKRIVPVYVGKYLYAASNYAYDDPTFVYFKGDKRSLPPTNLDGVNEVLKENRYTVYSNNKDWKKVINANVKKIFEEIKMNKEFVDLSISLQKGRVFVCMGYDDPLMVLPLQNQFNPKPTELYKTDVKNILKLIEEFNK